MSTRLNLTGPGALVARLNQDEVALVTMAVYRCLERIAHGAPIAQETTPHFSVQVRRLDTGFRIDIIPTD